MIPDLDDLHQVLIAKSESGTVNDVLSKMRRLMPSLLVFYYRSNALLQEYSFGEKKFRIPILLQKILNHEYLLRLARTIEQHYSFAVLKTRRSFVISDQYISTVALKIKAESLEYSNRHIGLKDTMLLVPLSKDFYIAFWNSTERPPFNANAINILDANRTFAINKTILNNSYTKSVAETEGVLTELLPYWRFKSPTQIFVGHTEKISSGFSKKKEVFYYENDEKAYEILTNHIQTRQYMEAKGYDRCPCRSGRQFKNCCSKFVKIARPAYEAIGDRYYMNDKVLDGPRNIEQPIDSWGPMSRPYGGRG